MQANRWISRIETALVRVLKPESYGPRWLAVQLTGGRAPSAGALAEGPDVCPKSNSFFENWMTTWSRKLAIARALSPVTSEVAASALRTELRRCECATELKSILPAAARLGAAVGRFELERALGAIDIFPRCAFLLTTFENLALEDVAVLLDTGRELVASAKSIGMIELVRNLAGGRNVCAARPGSVTFRPVRGAAIVRGWLWGTN